MRDRQLERRHLKYVHRLKRRKAEYGEYAAVIERGTKRVARIAPFAQAGELHRLSIYVARLIDVFARAEGTCTIAGAASASAALRAARAQIISAFETYVVEVAKGDIRRARGTLLASLRGGASAFRSALQAVAA